MIKADYYGLGIKFVKAYRENHSLYRLCRNSKRALLKPVFGGVLPLNFKNNSLHRNLRGHDFADNNYDTASKRVVFFCDTVQSTEFSKQTINSSV